MAGEGYEQENPGRLNGRRDFEDFARIPGKNDGLHLDHPPYRGLRAAFAERGTQPGYHRKISERCKRLLCLAGRQAGHEGACVGVEGPPAVERLRAGLGERHALCAQRPVPLPRLG